MSKILSLRPEYEEYESSFETVEINNTSLAPATVDADIEEINGINVVSSRVIASGLDKRHDHVMRDLDKILSDNPNVGSEIISNTYINTRGKEYREYLLTKDGFTLYMFNIQGHNDFKMAYINRFNEMERRLQEVNEKDRLRLQLFSKDPTEVVAAHKQLVDMEVEEATQPLLETIEEQTPSVAFADRVANASDAIPMRVFAKLLSDRNIKIGQNKLFDLLRRKGFLMENNEPYQRYVEQGIFKSIEQTYNTPYGQKLRTKTLVTGKGQIYLTEKIEKYYQKGEIH